MKQAAQTSSEQAVTQASNAISNYIGDMQEIMRLIEKNLTKSGGKSLPRPWRRFAMYARISWLSISMMRRDSLRIPIRGHIR